MGPPRRHWASSSKSKAAAKSNLTEVIANWKPHNQFIDRSDITVLEGARAWLAWYSKQKKNRPQNVAQYRKEIELSDHPNGDPDKICIANSGIAQAKAADVKTFHVRQHLEKLDGFTNKQKLHKTILRQTFKFLRAESVRDDNPVDDLEGYRGENGQRHGRREGPENPYLPDEPTPFTPAEYELYRTLEAKYFDSHRADRRYLFFTELEYALAARPGEICAIRLDEDIDFEASTVTIDGTVVSTGITVGKLRDLVKSYKLKGDQLAVRDDWQELEDDAIVFATFRQPFAKTEESSRTMKVDASILSTLRRMKLAAAPGQTLLFVTKKGGKVMRTVLISRVWEAIVSGTELAWSTPRTLRATHAQRVKERFGLAAARKILGHQENSKVTRQSYVTGEREVLDYPLETATAPAARETTPMPAPRNRRASRRKSDENVHKNVTGTDSFSSYLPFGM